MAAKDLRLLTAVLTIAAVWLSPSLVVAQPAPPAPVPFSPPPTAAPTAPTLGVPVPAPYVVGAAAAAAFLDAPIRGRTAGPTPLPLMKACS